MQTKHHITILLVLFLLAACSNQASRESFVTQQLSPGPEVVIFAPTLNIDDITPIHALTPTATMQVVPTQNSTLTKQILPTLTSTPADVESLPKLGEVILSSMDSENIYELKSNPLLQVTDATNELQGFCLWDCVKYRYSLQQSTLTIMLLRAGDQQKAESTLENLREDFLKVRHYEYTTSDIPTMPPGSWVIVDMAYSAEEHETGAAAIAHGSVVILVTYNRVWSDNLMEIAYPPVEFLNAQIRKLEAAGYPK